MIGYNLALPGNRAFTGLEALRPAVWNALRNLNATKEDKDIPEMMEVVDLEDTEEIPEMNGVWFYGGDILKTVDREKLTPDNTVKIPDSPVTIRQLGRFISIKKGMDPTRGREGILAGVLVKPPNHSWRLFVADEDDNGVFEYKQTSDGWSGYYLEAGDLGSNEQSTTSGLTFLAKSGDKLRKMMDDANKNIPNIQGTWQYFAELLKADEQGEMSLDKLTTMGPAPVDIKQKGPFITIDALGGLIAGVLWKDDTGEHILKAADHADNGLYHLRPTPQGWEGSYVERGYDPSNTEQTPTVGTILLAKTSPVMEGMITGRTMQMQNVPKLPRFGLLQIRGFKPKQREIVSGDIKDGNALFRITQNGPYLTFEQAFGNRNIPGIVTMENGIPVLYLPKSTDNGYHKLYPDSEGSFSGAYIESGTVGSERQELEVRVAKLSAVEQPNSGERNAGSELTNPDFPVDDGNPFISNFR